MATNYHVIENALDAVEVTVNNARTYDALVLGWDADKDVQSPLLMGKGQGPAYLLLPQKPSGSSSSSRTPALSSILSVAL